MADTDVIIVGGGPVGLGLAIDLALGGVSSLVLERTTALHRIPKGQNLTQRTGEHFRAWGISDQVRAASPIPPEFGNAGIVTYGKLLGDYSYDWFQRSKVRRFYFADNERLPQYALEEVLRRRVEAIPQIRFVTGATVTDVRQNGTGVDVVYQTDNGKHETRGEHRARARFTIGCDGARSSVRQFAGIEQDIDHEGPRMALLVFRSAQLHDLLERYPGKSIYNVMHPSLGGYWQFLGRVDLDGGWFFHAPVPEGTTEDSDFAALLHDVVGAEFKVEFDHIGFWDLRISHAKSYRAGQIFIAGDAAHSHPPYGGYGVNTGLEDARNLSWKLKAELAGWGGGALLDSYHAERHPVFESTSQDFIARMINDFRAFTEHYSPERDLDAFKTAWQARASGDDSDVTEFLPHYAGSPIVSGAPCGKSGAKGRHKVAAEAGYHLAPHPLPSGRDLWDLLGRGFVLLDFSDTGETAEAFERAARQRGVPFSLVRETSGAASQSYEAEMILVRPDLFVAWTSGSGDADPDAIIARAIGAI